MELLNDVIEPVTFAGPAGGRRTYHTYTYTYIYRRIAQHGTASVGLAQARPNKRIFCYSNCPFHTTTLHTTCNLPPAWLKLWFGCGYSGRKVMRANMHGEVADTRSKGKRWSLLHIHTSYVHSKWSTIINISLWLLKLTIPYNNITN